MGSAILYVIILHDRERDGKYEDIDQWGAMCGVELKDRRRS